MSETEILGIILSFIPILSIMAIVLEKYYNKRHKE